MSIESILVDFRNVDMGALRLWLGRLSGSLSTLTLGGLPTVLKETRALLNADLAHAANTIAMVYADASAVNNDIYIKVGASGAGSWTLMGVLQGVAADAAASRDSAGASALAAAASATAAGISEENAEDHKDAAQAAETSAETARDQASAFATSANLSMSAAATSAGQAQAFRDATIAAAVAARVFATKADANAALTGVPADAWVYVLADESQGGASWYYQKVSGAYVSRGAASLNGPVNTFMPPVVSNSSNISALSITPPSGLINSIGGYDGSNVKIFSKLGFFDNGPTGHENYFSQASGIGFNVLPNLGPLNRTLCASAWWFESKFAQGGPTDPFGCEPHLSVFVPTGGVGATTFQDNRLISGFSPLNINDWATKSELGFMSALIRLRDGVNNPRIDFNMSKGVNLVDLLSATVEAVAQDAVYFRTSQNNVPFHRQLNAAGNDYITNWQLDATDKFVLGTAIQINGVARASSVLAGEKGLAVFNAVSGMAANGWLSYHAHGNAISGTVNAGYDFNATLAHIQANNASAGGRIGHTTRSSNGVIFNTFRDLTNGRHIGLTYYPSGGGRIDLDDASQGGQFASKSAFSVDYATFQLRFAVAPRLPSFTVAGLPNPTTMGAGAEAFCTNETGGAVPVFSDATNWRRVTDRAIAA
jgi:hypothetical protein